MKKQVIKAQLFTKGIVFTSLDLKKVKIFLFPDENYDLNQIIAVIETGIEIEQFLPLLGPRSKPSRKVSTELIETIFVDGEVWDLDDYDYDDIEILTFFSVS